MFLRTITVVFGLLFLCLRVIKCNQLETTSYNNVEPLQKHEQQINKKQQQLYFSLKQKLTKFFNKNKSQPSQLQNRILQQNETLKNSLIFYQISQNCKKFHSSTSNSNFDDISQPFCLQCKPGFQLNDKKCSSTILYTVINFFLALNPIFFSCHSLIEELVNQFAYYEYIYYSKMNNRNGQDGKQMLRGNQYLEWNLEYIGNLNRGRFIFVHLQQIVQSFYAFYLQKKYQMFPDNHINYSNQIFLLKQSAPIYFVSNLLNFFIWNLPLTLFTALALNFLSKISKKLSQTKNFQSPFCFLNILSKKFSHSFSYFYCLLSTFLLLFFHNNIIYISFMFWNQILLASFATFYERVNYAFCIVYGIMVIFIIVSKSIAKCELQGRLDERNQDKEKQSQKQKQKQKGKIQNIGLKIWDMMMDCGGMYFLLGLVQAMSKFSPLKISLLFILHLNQFIKQVRKSNKKLQNRYKRIIFYLAIVIYDFLLLILQIRPQFSQTYQNLQLIVLLLMEALSLLQILMFALQKFIQLLCYIVSAKQFRNQQMTMQQQPKLKFKTKIRRKNYLLTNPKKNQNIVIQNLIKQQTN